jgi:hypothetical protein
MIIYEISFSLKRFLDKTSFNNHFREIFIIDNYDYLDKLNY